jgi:hypothetical protein
MQTIQFEGRKIAMKQDRTGYVLTLSVHPDELPEMLVRDFVGARYQIVMVRLTDDDTPMVREQEYPSKDIVRLAGVLCRDPLFHAFLVETGQVFDEDEESATSWLRMELNIQSRAELKTNQTAATQFRYIHQEFQAWKALR